jgi:hypothetical protein
MRNNDASKVYDERDEIIDEHDDIIDEQEKEDYADDNPIYYDED